MYKRMASGGIIRSIHDYGWGLEFLSRVVKLGMKRKGGNHDPTNQEDPLRH
jgi:hypothetical protein